MKKQYFGTDGIRGRVGEHPITPDFMLKLGWAVGRVFGEREGGHVLVGKDTRISGYMFESALEAGLSAAGMNTRLLGPMPTPAIAYLTRTFRAQAGIVISASHNPFDDNGIKFFSTEGMKLPDELELEIEQRLEEPLVTVDSGRIGKARRLVDAAGRYIEFCKGTISARMDFAGTKVVVDCANGSTYHIAPHVFTEVGAQVITIASDPNGLNINDQCGACHIENLQKAVLENKADLGIALDGDGDRLIMVDHTGEVVDGDQLLFIIARSRLEAGKLRGPVIGTLMSNLGLQQALARLGVSMDRAAVGDRYVMERMLEHDSILGGESSGHIICRDRTTTGDGVVAALQIFAEIWRTGRTLFELRSDMEKFPQRLVNVRVTRRENFEEIPVIRKAWRTAENELGQDGRILLRYSGTEPLVRVMVEGKDAHQVNELVGQLAESVKIGLGSA